MAYADFSFYTDTYIGNAISESEFDRLIIRASSYIDHITHGRAASYSPVDTVKMAACAAAEAWQKNEQGGELQSQSVGSWSKSFAMVPKTSDEILYDSVSMYLSDTGLLTRWV